MHGVSPVVSTPASSRVFDGEHRHGLSKHIFPSYACAFLDDETSDEGCSINPVTGSPLTCRRSPRLLANGYYILTEDSLLSDEEGNITLMPSQTSVTYKENLVRVFRRRKKIRRSLASLFSLGASNSWLSNTVLSNLDSSHGDDSWAERCSQLEVSQSDFGNSDLSEYKGHVSERGDPAAANGASLRKDKGFIQPRKLLCASLSCSPFVTDDNKETLSSADTAVSSFVSPGTSFKTTQSGK
ncbi:transmembrane protein 71 [Eudromia elegans]